MQKTPWACTVKTMSRLAKRVRTPTAPLRRTVEEIDRAEVLSFQKNRQTERLLHVEIQPSDLLQPAIQHRAVTRLKGHDKRQRGLWETRFLEYRVNADPKSRQYRRELSDNAEPIVDDETDIVRHRELSAHRRRDFRERCKTRSRRGRTPSNRVQI